MGSRHTPLLVAWLMASASLCPDAHAAVELCVETHTDGDDPEAFRTLVLTEVGRHPTHTVVEEECDSHLAVTLFRVEGVLFLTARIGLEVPVRYRIEDEDDIARRLEEGLALVLGNDPVHLMEDITRYNAIQRAVHSVLKKGHNIWRLELFQAIGRSDLNHVFPPGAAFSATRGADHWYVHARLYFAGWPGTLAEDERALRILTGLDAGFTYETSRLAGTTFYVGLGFGLQFLRYDGYVEDGGEPLLDHVNRFGVTLSSRIGVRFLRFYDFDLDVFAAGYLPLFSTRQTDALLFGEKGIYTPTIQVGIGVGF